MNVGSAQWHSLNGELGRLPCATCGRYSRVAQKSWANVHLR